MRPNMTLAYLCGCAGYAVSEERGQESGLHHHARLSYIAQKCVVRMVSGDKTRIVYDFSAVPRSVPVMSDSSLVTML